MVKREKVLEEHVATGDRMAEDNEKMGYFGKENLIPDGAFSPESKYYLLLGNPISTILGIEFLILRGAHRTVHSG